MFQRYHLLPHLDARGNAALPAVYAGLRGALRGKKATALLDEAAKRIMLQSLFRPGRVGGRAVKVLVSLPVDFTLKR